MTNNDKKELITLLKGYKISVKSKLEEDKEYFDYIEGVLDGIDKVINLINKEY